MLTQLDHIDLKVPNLEAAVTFLEGLGLQVVRRTHPDRGTVEMALRGEQQIVFELREDAALEATTLNHIAFRSDALATDVTRLGADGVTISKQPTRIEHSGRTVANVVDATGRTWQITE